MDGHPRCTSYLFEITCERTGKVSFDCLQDALQAGVQVEYDDAVAWLIEDGYGLPDARREYLEMCIHCKVKPENTKEAYEKTLQDMIRGDV